MGLVYYDQADAAVAREVADVVRQKQFRREVEQVYFAFAHLAVDFGLLFRREVGRGVSHARVTYLLQAFYLVYDEGFQWRYDQGECAVFAAQPDGGQLEQQ